MYAKRLPTLLAAILLLNTALSSCMVGPDFHSPATPKLENYTKTPLPPKTVSAKTPGSSGKAQDFQEGQSIPSQWWELFHSEELNDLICKGLKNSPNLAAAQAALRQAQENLTAQIGSTMFPSVTANLSGQRQRFSNVTIGENLGAETFNLYNASVNASYTLDLFGGNRRALEALGAQVNYQQFQVEAAYLTLTSNIVTAAITEASLREQILATQELIKEQRENLTIVQRQFDLGGASGSDVLSQQTQLATLETQLPPLQQSLAQTRHQLAVLVGEYPSESDVPCFNLNTLNLPKELPLSVPSILVRHRPDIRASEALLHAASAQVGVATANLYPQITLSGSFGYTQSTTANLFNYNNAIWSYGSQLAQPIFNAGSLRAKRRSSIAAFDQACAQYRQTVLQAFQNVADVLRALQNDALSLRARQLAETSAYETLKITRKQYQLGGVSYLSLLNAQLQYQQAKISRIQAQAARYTDTAALFQALGGGWWNRICDAEKQQTTQT